MPVHKSTETTRTDKPMKLPKGDKKKKVWKKGEKIKTPNIWPGVRG